MIIIIRKFKLALCCVAVLQISIWLQSAARYCKATQQNNIGYLQQQYGIDRIVFGKLQCCLKNWMIQCGVLIRVKCLKKLWLSAYFVILALAQ